MIGSSCQILPLPEKLTETVSVSAKNDDLSEKKESKWEYIHLNVEQGPGLKNFKLVPDKML